MKDEFEASLSYNLIKVPDGAYQVDYRIQFPGEEYFGIQLKTVMFQMRNGKRHSSMNFPFSKEELDDRYGNVVTIGAVVKPFTAEEIEWIRKNQDDGSKKMLAKIFELYLLDGSTTRNVYGDLASRISNFGENMLTLDLGTSKGLELLVAFFANVRKAGANKRKFSGLRDFLEHCEQEFHSSMRNEVRQWAIIDDIMGENGYVHVSGFSGRGLSFLNWAINY